MTHMGKKRRSGATDAQIVASYLELLSVYKVAKATGVSVNTIYRVLELEGVERVGLEHYRANAARFTPEVEKEIRRRYEGGEYYAQLVEAFGGTIYSIKMAIKRAGGALVEVTPTLKESEKTLIAQMRKDGFSQMAISLAIGRSQPAVSRLLRRGGEVFKPMSGERHTNWKGGRYVDGQGYIRAWTAADDPMRSMALNSGHVLEHRLVMARSLGRPLRRSETVHHINGDKADNRIENLQLRQGKHGKHVVMCCLDCGSRNIGTAPLAETSH